uniref:SSD domain-containing protein n=1 Tax=Angiostrongylus cantonensis TaxID=6313 RepID=A0A0K0DE52_ANGCA
MVSSRFLMYDSNTKTDQSFKEFCGGFCLVNEPVRQFYNGMRALQGNTSAELEKRISLTYPTSEIFSTKFSLLPHFFGVELNEDGETLKSVGLIALLFRAEKHPSWTPEMVKEWELKVGHFFAKEYNQTKIQVNALSPAIVERDIVRSGEYLQPFILVGFVIMCTFCATTTIISSVVMFHHRITFNKVILAVTACIVPFLACGTAFGVIFLLGVTFSPLLCITPFLALAISVDDAFLMIHAWNRIESDDIQILLLKLQVLSETGPAIAISAITNVLAFGSGAISSPPEIRIFCIGNAACIFLDMCYQPDARISLIVIFVWTVYVAGAIVGLFHVKIDLSPQKLFLPDSNIIEADRIHNTYVIPFYTPATVVVNNPGNISDPDNIRELFAVKRAFESIPDAIGPESTKFFLSDYIAYEATFTDELGDESSSVISIDDFLKWPEYSYWKGFVKKENESQDIARFMFITGYHGAHLVLWSERARLLRSWREQVDHFAKRFNLSVFTEDGFYIDLLESIPSITWQSALATFISVVVVCSLFISHAATVVFVAMSVFATCIGVFSYMSMFGMTLDPMVMAISIMCIGFSVDIPAHVSFHFHADFICLKENPSQHYLHSRPIISKTFSQEFTLYCSNQYIFRLLHTLCSIGFPVIQAGLSTNICVLPLIFVPLYMAQNCHLNICLRLLIVHETK